MRLSEQDKNGEKIAAAIKGGSIHILLADDHALMRQVLADLLESQKGFEIIAQAANGREAVQLATALKPHVVLMDVSMPEVNGIEATLSIRDQLPDTRIIGMSLNNDTITRQNMLGAGCRCQRLSG